MNPKSPSLRQRLNRYLRRSPLTLAAFSALLVSAPNTAAAQGSTRSTLSPPMLRAIASDSVRIYLMTIGQGDEVYELFGHNAIWVHDPKQPMDTVYNWGVFSFDQPHFILRFLRGDMEYMMLGEPLDATIAFYRSLNRQVWAQELDLTAAEKKSLVDFLHWNERPENANYRYDYYLDNCSTRVRDAIDRATGGQVRPQLKAIKTNETYRSHSLRLMQGMRAMVSGVELLLGRPTDVKLSADGASFLPVQLMAHLRDVRVDGKPLYKVEFTINDATRPPEPDRVPRLWLWFAPIGLALAVFVLWVGRGLDVGRLRRTAAFSVSFLSAVLGVLGTIIAGLVTLTNHTAAHANENFFMLNPLWLIIAGLAPVAILRQKPRRATSMLVVTAAGLACLALLTHIIGLSRQANWDAMILVLPVELAIAWTVTSVSRSTTSAPGLPDARIHRDAPHGG